jgi:cyclic-di-GMP phosphodiesterase TipF (flagellum assembly factor)
VREGLRMNRIDLYVQPVVSLPQRKRRHLECFSRIRTLDGAILLPQQYIGVAAREGLIGAIDNMLLFRSVQLARRLQKAQSRLFSIFVNISEHTLADAVLLPRLRHVHGREPRLAPTLTFEFMQSHVQRLGGTVMLELERLARLGFRFSMDQVSELHIDADELGRRHFRTVKVEAARLLEQSRQGFDVRAFKAALDRNGIDLIVDKIEIRGDPGRGARSSRSISARATCSASPARCASSAHHPRRRD